MWRRKDDNLTDGGFFFFSLYISYKCTHPSAVMGIWGVWGVFFGRLLHGGVVSGGSLLYLR